MSVMPPPLAPAVPQESGKMEVGEHWRRLHPLSPIVRFGRVLIGVVVVAVPSIAEQPPRDGRSDAWDKYSSIDGAIHLA